MIADELLSLFLSGTVDRVELIYTKFVSLISSRPVIQTLLPLDPQGFEVQDDEIFRLTSKGGEFQVSREKVSAPTMKSLPRDMIFEARSGANSRSFFAFVFEQPIAAGFARVCC